MDRIEEKVFISLCQS